MHRIFSPSSIVVVGGSNDLQKPGGKVVWNIKTHGFPSLSVVNASGQAVQRLPTYPSVDQLPSAPELAIISVPAAHVLSAVEGLLRKGTRGFVVLSCGFSEVDSTGRELEQSLVTKITQAGGHLIGPNSLGVFTPEYFGVFGGPDLTPVPGTIDFVSASGSTAAFIMEAGLDRGLHFASMTSVGNGAQLGVEDILAYQDQVYGQAPVRTKLLYVESIKDPKRMVQHARSLARKGCYLVALKAGTSEVGARAAQSHTGAMATSDVAVSALFDKAGIIRVHTKTEMTDVAGLLTSYGCPANRNIVIVTHAGGPGIILADALSRQGFRIPELSSRTQERLREQLSPGSSTRNPVDFLASGSAENLHHILRVLGQEEADNIGGVCVIFGSPGLFNVWPVFQVIVEAMGELPFPIYPVLPSTRTAADEARMFQKSGYYFTDESSLAEALGRVVSAPALGPDEVTSPVIDERAIRGVVVEARKQHRHQLSPDQAARILSAVGIDVPRQAVVRDADEAVQKANEIGYPVALKVVGPLHKSDVGGVVLDLHTDHDVRRTHLQLMSAPQAQGILVQEQVKGLEWIVGVSKETGFGHLVAFGLGGVFTETLSDVRMGLTPLSEDEARRLVTTIRAARLLQGGRGRPPVDVDALVGLLTRLSALSCAFPQIKEADINPLVSNGRGLWAVDARILWEEIPDVGRSASG